MQSPSSTSYIIDETVLICSLLPLAWRCLMSGIGGGVYLDDSNATFSECRFESNLAEGSDLFGPSASAGGGLATRGPDFITNIRSVLTFEKRMASAGPTERIGINNACHRSRAKHV